LKIYFIL